MPRPSSFALHAPAYFANLRVVGRGLLRVATYCPPLAVHFLLILSFARELIPSEELNVPCHVSTLVAVYTACILDTFHSEHFVNNLGCEPIACTVSFDSSAGIWMLPWKPRIECMRPLINNKL
jgi:hypothetical protein